MGGRVMVPLRFVSEALGVEVKWQAFTRTVSILSATGGPVEPLPQPQIMAPRIYSVTHNATQVLMPGDTVTVFLHGDAGGYAALDITGVTTGVPMREVSSGQYQGSYTVQQGADATNAPVTGHLRIGGKETTQAAVKPVSMTLALPPMSQMQVTPQPGSEAASARPQVSAMFSTPLQPGSVRFSVDGIDYSGQVQVYQHSVIWNPPFNLAAGEHIVLLTATGTSGEELRRKWNFYVSASSSGSSSIIYSVRASPPTVAVGQAITVRMEGAAGGIAIMSMGSSQSILMTESPAGVYTATMPAPAEMQGRYADLQINLKMPDGRIQTTTQKGAVFVGGVQGSLALSVLSPTDGGVVPQVFDISGYTEANATVTLQVTAQHGVVGTLLGITQEVLNTQTRADQNGHFSFHVDAGPMSSGSRIFLVIRARNDMGLQSDEKRIELTRQ